ncbi:hypothetical protein BBO99_00000154 [Phytophthora kernoviae]|uniref:PhoD-like phosphatase metallophosphatase domain-containing protein n=2 Tax=Phytophthora kernoviae TaxID=325452 RepID=A0A421ESP5_9STRA|nr:hypothetical protein G195_001409 [Phytophthora kernoviae 00238/432]KAG2531513.1 hypothetical protein JM18_000386 [Phytophthora kernoviae]KAG2532677.1 hypothetical protein JM16_000278 [Phytophthora kernoviae]RLM96781.1 hypothetical protein BBI17_000256 [Phytophthora kernoviae]RLN85816.1 hypothetical protein BBO99_00000154 [Phytophthora kernoviae]
MSREERKMAQIIASIERMEQEQRRPAFHADDFSGEQTDASKVQEQHSGGEFNRQFRGKKGKKGKGYSAKVKAGKKLRVSAVPMNGMEPFERSLTPKKRWIQQWSAQMDTVTENPEDSSPGGLEDKVEVQEEESQVESNSAPAIVASPVVEVKVAPSVPDLEMATSKIPAEAEEMVVVPADKARKSSPIPSPVIVEESKPQMEHVAKTMTTTTPTTISGAAAAASTELRVKTPQNTESSHLSPPLERNSPSTTASISPSAKVKDSDTPNTATAKFSPSVGTQETPVATEKKQQMKKEVSPPIATAAVTGAIDNPLLLVVGDVTTSSARILYDQVPISATVLRLHVKGSPTRMEGLKVDSEDEQSLELPLTEQNRCPHVVELRDLQSGRRYVVQFAVDDQEEVATVMFHTARLKDVVGKGEPQTDRVLVVSCDRFVDDHDDVMMERLANDIEAHDDATGASSVHFGMAHLGDQIYADAGPLSIKVVPISMKEIRDGVMKRARYNAVLEQFRGIYRKTFGRKAAQRVLRVGAHWMLPDDHEVINNFNFELVQNAFQRAQSPEVSEKERERLAALQLHCRAGLQAYYEFQYQLNREFPWDSVDFLEDSLGDIIRSYPMYFAVELQQMKLLFLDVRFERSFFDALDEEELSKLSVIDASTPKVLGMVALMVALFNVIITYRVISWWPRTRGDSSLRSTSRHKGHWKRMGMETELMWDAGGARDAGVGMVVEGEARDRLLKARCNALFDDNKAYVAPTEALALWNRDIQSIQKRHTPAEQQELRDEALRAYETGVAIASKQRQFELATALVTQMKELGYTVTDQIHQYVIRNVALKLLKRPKHTPIEELREVLKDVTDDMWEREIMSVIDREEQPVHLKTKKEHALFKNRLIAAIEAKLDEYEHEIGLQDGKKVERSTAPYNEALRVYADNSVPFSHMLELMVARGLVADVGTYDALLLGARWNEIPATVTQLLESNLVDQLSASSSVTNSDSVRQLWVNAMKAIVHSSSERFGSPSASVSKREVDQLRKIFLFVDKKLSNGFPKFCFALVEQQDEVYNMRVKAAAACGLVGPVKRILDEYVARSSEQTLSKTPFLTALEVFPWSQMDILLLTREDALARAEDRDVRTSPRVKEMKRIYERVMQKLNKAQETINKLEQKANSNKDMPETERLALQQELTMAARTVDEESYTAHTLERRLTQARVLKANQLLIQDNLKRGDRMMEHVLDKLLDAGFDVENDLDLNIKLMEQYMTSALRFEKRLAQRQKHVGPHIMSRVFKLVSTVSEHVKSGGMDVQDPEIHDKLLQFFERAVCAAVRFWREDETTAILNQQQRVLGTNKLDQREYDLLIFQRVTNLDVRGAHSLLEEMHFAGMKPSQEAIHRIAIGLLHQLHAIPEGFEEMARKDNEENADDEVVEEGKKQEDEESNTEVDAELGSEVSELLDVSDRDAIEKELGLSDALRFDGDEKFNAQSAAARVALLGSDAPMTIEDLTGFLQDWYNLYRVKPSGKTVVPVLARLLDTNNLPEFRRLLQILESMEGGLTPATELWLEKRLKQHAGKTLDDFRLKRN